MNRFVFIVFIIFWEIGFSQSVSGIISDKNGERIPFANIYLNNTNIGTSSNENGFY